MKKIAYLIILAVTAFGFIACEDNNDETIFEMGNWDYKEPHFEFEYATDTIAFGMPDSEIKIAVKEIKTVFLAMATEKMKDYFVGIDFYSVDSLLIKAQMSTTIPMNIRANYKISNEIIEITLNKEDMSKIMGDAAANIPSISFKYIQSKQRMDMYIDKSYIILLWNIEFIQDKLVELIFSTIPDSDRIPPHVKPIVITDIIEQISAILNQIEKLELGFVLTK